MRKCFYVAIAMFFTLAVTGCGGETVPEDAEAASSFCGDGEFYFFSSCGWRPGISCEYFKLKE